MLASVWLLSSLSMPALLLSTALVATAGVSAPSEPVSVLSAFLDAANRHDVEGVLKLLHRDFTFRDAARSFTIRRDEFRPALGWDATVRGHSRASILEVRGETLWVRLTESNDFLEALAIDSIEHDVRYRIVDGRIREIVLLEADTVSARVDAAMEPVLGWLRAHRPGSLEGLLADGRPIYTAETARRWLDLLAQVPDEVTSR